MDKNLRPPAREAIIDAAFAVFSRDPSASLSEVAERAGVGRATLHRYFSSRGELVRALARIAIVEMDAAEAAACAGARSYSEALRLCMQALIPLGDRYGFLALEMLEDDAELVAEFHRQQKETAEAVEAAKKEGLFDRAVPTSWIVQAYDHLIYAGWESVRVGEATPAQAAQLAWKTLTQGLRR